MVETGHSLGFQTQPVDFLEIHHWRKSETRDFLSTKLVNQLGNLLFGTLDLQAAFLAYQFCFFAYQSW
jgi:hypothetical protein